MTNLERYIRDRYWGFDRLTLDMLCFELSIPLQGKDVKLIKELITERVGRKQYRYERISMELFCELCEMMLAGGEE